MRTYVPAVFAVAMAVLIAPVISAQGIRVEPGKPIGIRTDHKPEEKPQKATLRIKRIGAFTGYFTEMTVSADGTRLGDINSGETKEFTFTPNKSGKTKIFVYGWSKYFNADEAKTVEVGDGDVVEASCTNNLAGDISVTVAEVKKAKPALRTVAKFAKVVKVEKTSEIIDKYEYTEPYATIPGVPRTVKGKFEWTAALTSTVSVGVEAAATAKIGSDLIASAGAELRGKVETAVGVTVGMTRTHEEDFHLDGEKVLKLKIRWVTRYRKVNVTLADGTTVPCYVCIGARGTPEPTK